MFEPLNYPLASRRRFARRMFSFLVVAITADGAVLFVGATAFRIFESLPWIDSMVNSAFVMTGNGPMNHPVTNAGKIFCVFDALVGVTIFTLVVGVLLAPVFHRILHKLQLERQSELSDE